MYDDEKPGTVKPPQGQKLNKPALISLQKILMKQSESMEEKEQYLRDLC